jgi:leader peptidase (prepilin peptidase)/N-methyltransferase
MLEELTAINLEFPWFFRFLAFMLGAVVGSFLNVCIYRIPVGRSVITPGSRCACGRPIAWFDNIPIFSWAILRGRSRCCGRRFGIRYPAIELLTALLFLASWWLLPPTIAVVGMLLSSILICATFIDLDHMIIPDRFTIGAAVVGVIVSLLIPTLHVTPSGFHAVDVMRSGLASILGLLIGSGIILWIALLAEVILRKEAMGFGDVKFLGAIGAFVGWKGAVFSIFGGAVIGTIAIAIVLLIGNLRPRDTKPLPRTDGDAQEPDPHTVFGRQTPFGPMLAAGGLLYFLLLRPYVDAYFANISDLFR